MILHVKGSKAEKFVAFGRFVGMGLRVKGLRLECGCFLWAWKDFLLGGLTVENLSKTQY